MDFMALRPEYLTFDKILSNRLFSIPSYQRAYSWKEKQRKELFNDILKLYQGKDCNRHHFMATIVCLDKNENICYLFYIFILKSYKWLYANSDGIRDSRHPIKTSRYDNKFW